MSKSQELHDYILTIYEHTTSYAQRQMVLSLFL
jgi:hypothetical protein